MPRTFGSDLTVAELRLRYQLDEVDREIRQLRVDRDRWAMIRGRRWPELAASLMQAGDPVDACRAY